MKTKKEYKLPKAFADKWLTALRSGEYKQGQSALHSSKDNTYCCLGVACHLLGIDNEILANGIYDEEYDDYGDNGYPADVSSPFKEAELLHNKFFYNAVASLNDGADFYWDTEKKMQIPYTDINKLNPNKIVINKEKKKHTFEEISKWIEDNVEFTE